MKKRIPSILSIGEIMKLLLATQNLHKILELKAILKESFDKIDLYSLRDFKDYEAPIESEDTFEGNATLKALDAAKHFNMLALADDSGLIVPALKTSPGVFSARYAGENPTAKENMTKLLAEMKDLKGDKRNAYYSCTLCLASPEKVIKIVTGTCEGRILEEIRGAGGFGYDPLFLKHDYSHSFAEIQTEIKLKVSHRSRAFEKLRHTLEVEFQCTTS
ncbi:MAG: dITP/XTP pyrophosphatase [Chlamydiia bacterium]|nr:dITP/XTP pyrophosphatase [Chlamydiia bacterium]